MYAKRNIDNSFSFLRLYIIAVLIFSFSQSLYSSWLWGDWESGKDFYPFYIDNTTLYDGNFIKQVDDRFYLYDYNWLDDNIELTVIKGSGKSTFRLMGDGVARTLDNSIITYQEKERISIFSYSLSDKDKPELLQTKVLPNDWSVVNSNCLTYFSKNDSVLFYSENAEPIYIRNGIYKPYYLSDSVLVLMANSNMGKIFNIYTDGRLSQPIRIILNYNGNINIRVEGDDIYAIGESRNQSLASRVSKKVYKLEGNSFNLIQELVDTKDFIATGGSYYQIYTDKITLGNKSISTKGKIDFLGSAEIMVDGEPAVFAFFRNGIIALQNGRLIADQYIDLSGLKGKGDLEAEYYEGRLILTGNSNTANSIANGITYSMRITKNKAFMINRVLDRLLLIMITLTLVSIAFYLYQKYKRASRETRELTEDLQGGIFFTVDESGIFQRQNKESKEILVNETGRVSFKKLKSKEGLEDIYRMINNVLKDKKDSTYKVHIIQGIKHSEYMFQASVLRGSIGSFRGAVFYGTDITEELERKRLRNWAQLAHDMQTNLSVIRLNTEQLQIMAVGADLQKLNKIKHQSDIMLKRVRDIVTIGRGGEVKFQPVNIKMLIQELEIEFQDSDDNTEYRFHSQDFVAELDANKVTRAVRNAIENARKAVFSNGKQTGRISVTAYKELRYFYIKVDDNGHGMDDQVKNRMLTPYFTTGAASGGSGIGTMVMTSVMELHNGTLSIDSNKGDGTTVVFRFPVKQNSSDSAVNSTEEI
jgi:signal transduction histidine kinase